MGIKKYKISGRQTDIHTAQPLVLDYKLQYDHSNIKICNESEYKGNERKYFNPFNAYFLMHLYMPTLLCKLLEQNIHAAHPDSSNNFCLYRQKARCKQEPQMSYMSDMASECHAPFMQQAKSFFEHDNFKT